MNQGSVINNQLYWCQKSQLTGYNIVKEVMKYVYWKIINCKNKNKRNYVNNLLPMVFMESHEDSMCIKEIVRGTPINPKEIETLTR